MVIIEEDIYTLLDKLTIFSCKVSVKPFMVNMISYFTITAMKEGLFIFVAFWVSFVNNPLPGNVLGVELLILDTLDLHNSLASCNSHGAWEGLFNFLVFRTGLFEVHNIAQHLLASFGIKGHWVPCLRLLTCMSKWTSDSLWWYRNATHGYKSAS